MPFIALSAQEIGSPNDYDGMNNLPFINEDETVINTRRFIYTTGIIDTGKSAPSYSWGFSSSYLEEGKHIIIVQSGSTLEVSYVDYLGIFPVDYITYLDVNHKSLNVGDWDELPNENEAIHITKLREDPKDYVEGTLDVTVSSPDGSGSGTFKVYVFADYNDSRDFLLEEVNKRRYNAPNT